MRIVKTNQLEAAPRVPAAAFTYSGFGLARDVDGRWSLTAPATFALADLAHLERVIAVARALPAAPVAEVEFSVGGATVDDGTALADAQSLSAARGTFGAAFGEGGPLQQVEDSATWPSYTFENDEALLAAANAEPLQHDARGLWRALQDRVGQIGEPSRWTPGYESTKQRAAREKKSATTREAFSAAIKRVQEIAFGPSFSTDELQKKVYAEYQAAEAGTVANIVLPDGTPYEWMRASYDIRHVIVTGGDPDVIAKGLWDAVQSLKLDDTSVREFVAWACDGYDLSERVQELVQDLRLAASTT